MMASSSNDTPMFEKEGYHGADYKENRDLVVAELVSLGYSLPTNFLYSSNSDTFTSTANIVIDPAMDIPRRLLSWDVLSLLPKGLWPNMKLYRDEGSILGNVVLLPPNIPPSTGDSVPRAQRKRAKLKIEAKKGCITTRIHSLYNETPYTLEILADGDVELYIPASFRGLLRLTAPRPQNQQPQVILCDELKNASTPLGDNWWSRERKWYVGDNRAVTNKTEEGDEVVVDAKTGRINVYYVEDLALEIN
ncbi:hypothetical protein CONPUDRAFT_144212 [Coniophora puteana RWD-64-598 SS2]|uniref:DUF7330 domain-containing protein n=1 Tax=Coniophora puteana (strain RWD-64-598) TaxID=741705 RepID=A0A5M3MQH4_CONPW|nr:uncharacterized protein CONPUDRAFT_144212 [Coniophora puteana RWD-64-598 SS2]EIW81439.1 hypothetical protein CONPUDRAFT_144212 [Coniophora puteana RWD-64-598 SS2]